jgi:hypothetical protein
VNLVCSRIRERARSFVDFHCLKCSRKCPQSGHGGDTAAVWVMNEHIVCPAGAVRREAWGRLGAGALKFTTNLTRPVDDLEVTFKMGRLVA